MCIITSVLRNAYGSLHDVRTANLIRRGLVLFTVGAFLALVLNLLQIQRHVTLFPEEVMATLFSSAWWIPPCCGTGAGESTTRSLEQQKNNFKKCECVRCECRGTKPGVVTVR